MPSLLRRVFNRGPIPLPGGSSIVNANGWDASKGFQVNWAPSMRMVVDLGDLDASTWVNQTGNSGHPNHPNYVDQLDTWAAGASFPWPFTKDAVDAARQYELTLTPHEPRWRSGWEVCAVIRVVKAPIDRGHGIRRCRVAPGRRAVPREPSSPKPQPRLHGPG